jgi:hypothetical protein
MSDTKITNANKLIINISDIEMATDSEIMNNGKIYEERYISIDGKVPYINMKMADNLENISIRKFAIRIRIINNTIRPGQHLFLVYLIIFNRKLRSKSDPKERNLLFKMQKQRLRGYSILPIFRKER